MKQTIILSLVLICLLKSTSLFTQTYNIYSPDQSIEVRVSLTDKVYYQVLIDGNILTWHSPISMTLSDGTVLGQKPKLKDQRRKENRTTIQPLWGTRSSIEDHYNELELQFEGDFSLYFRVFNNGVAYRFHTDLPGSIKIKTEEIAYHFQEDAGIYAHIVENYQTSYEKLYTKTSINKLVDTDTISLPLLIHKGKIKIAITEADLYDYPGFYLYRRANNKRFELKGLLPQFPTQWQEGGWSQFNLRVSERADYLAETKGTRDFPWRLMILAREDKELAENNLVYQLARPAAIETDWIKPGKVAWDWWNDWNLEGVNFETGINTKTYEYYIDFAARNGLEYVILDEGWSDQFDVFLMNPEVDVPYLIEYAKKKNVALILWCVWHTLERQLEEALDLFEKWGVAGIKVDFFDRDDQIVINFYEELAKEAAKRKLLLDYHGCSKPTGLHRTYPNLVNYEGVRGNEYNKFSTNETPGHNIDIVYTRMLAGPIDYTPGAMRNSTQGNFLMDNSNPMSYGTRCHQLGMYVVYFSPLQMLCDAPTAYEKYPDILEFLSNVPVSWDETIILDGKLGEYVVTARRKGNDWYLGALNNWTEREVELDLSFLGRATYRGQLFLDGINANRKAEDYQYQEKDIKGGSKLKILLKKGGGMVAQLSKK